MMYYSCYESPVGFLRLESDGENLTGLYFTEESAFPSAEIPLFAAVKNWLDVYFAGSPREPDFPIRLTGTAFQLQVWEILRSIPFGETLTYGDIAREMAMQTGKIRMSAQAVGQAVGRNPVSIIIPCHRVIGAGGKLTGYAAGLEKKILLLKHEGYLK